jgi:hypothetical protein
LIKFLLFIEKFNINNMNGHQSINFLSNITSNIINISNLDDNSLRSSLQPELDNQIIQENYLFMTKVLYLFLTLGLTLFFGFLPLIW